MLTAVVLAGLGLPLAGGPAMAGCSVADIRPDISSRWKDGRGNLRWPVHEWSTEISTTVVLPPGMVIDRFGCETGTRFNPQGTAFSTRALPYDCVSAAYFSYRVVKPLVAWSGRTPAWFDQKGGALQFRTTATAAQLLAEGAIEVAEAGRPSCG
ncbi:hypothetical protein H261_01971 [Paramagnetospirillum caucaseum]|uniref:TNT domain-containing protein n=1 Tax=Paramagnetospirillum caucaseum TaxID=1244869 RepID=M2ZB72_9PROT|nr:hypothetical protein H261_01971 [Paramagnetospirillum caucaseum]